LALFVEPPLFLDLDEDLRRFRAGGFLSSAVSLLSSASAAVRRRAHRPMEHIQGFTRSQWMPPLGECSHRIAAAAAMVDDLE